MQSHLFQTTKKFYCTKIFFTKSEFCNGGQIVHQAEDLYVFNEDTFLCSPEVPGLVSAFISKWMKKWMERDPFIPAVTGQEWSNQSIFTCWVSQRSRKVTEREEAIQTCAQLTQFLGTYVLVKSHANSWTGTTWTSADCYGILVSISCLPLLTHKGWFLLARQHSRVCCDVWTRNLHANLGFVIQWLAIWQYRNCWCRCDGNLWIVTPRRNHSAWCQKKGGAGTKSEHMAATGASWNDELHWHYLPIKSDFLSRKGPK